MNKDNKSTVYYKEVQADIKNKINKGDFKAGNKIPSERELCDHYSVSRTTIRKAIDNLVSQSYLKKEPGKGTFVLDRNIKTNFDENLTGNILFVRCIHSDHKNNNSTGNDIFYPELLIGIEEYMSTEGYHCIYKTINETTIQQEKIEQLISKVEGVIWGGELYNKEFLDHLLDIKIPLVFVSPSFQVENTDSVNIDDFNGAKKAVDYLIKNNHRKIAFIAGDNKSHPSQEREKGYTEALKSEKIKVNNELVIANGWEFEDGYQAFKELINKKLKFTSIFAASDSLALGAMSAAKDMGYNIPEDLSIIGFDDVALSNQVKPNLTTMHVMKKEMGETAAKLLFELISDQRSYPVNVVLPVSLVERNSVNYLSNN